MAFLSPQSTLSLSLSSKRNLVYAKYLEKRKSILRHWIRKVMILDLDQVYIPFGLRNNRKENWKRENTFWIKLGQSVYTGRVRYKRDYKNRAYPFGPNRLVSSKPTSRHSSSHLGRPRISPRKRREGDRIGEGLHQD